MLFPFLPSTPATFPGRQQKTVSSDLTVVRTEQGALGLSFSAQRPRASGFRYPKDIQIIRTGLEPDRMSLCSSFVFVVVNKHLGRKWEQTALHSQVTMYRRKSGQELKERAWAGTMQEHHLPVS